MIPESLKFSHWLSEIKRIIPWNCCLQTLTKRYHAPTRLPHKAHLRIGTFTDGRYYMFSMARRAICGVGWVGGVLEPQTEHCGFRRPLPRLVMFDLKHKHLFLVTFTCLEKSCWLRTNDILIMLSIDNP